MPVMPYVNRPLPPTVCLLTVEGDVLSEHGEHVDLDDFPAGYRVWCDYDTVRALVADGRGEALCWNGEEIRWRHERHDGEDEWRRRATDVHVIKLPFPSERSQALRALGLWRDWLGSYGASPVGTMGGTSWSLLRACLTKPLWCSSGEKPPLRRTAGGRQELGPAGQGRFEGKLEHYDLPAAYASELGHLSYGGHWSRASELPLCRGPEWWAASGRPVFVRAIVRVPDLPYGPLLRRPRGRLAGSMGLLRSALLSEYPVGCRLQGVWTWQELEQAEAWGCRIVRVLESWVHLAEGQPFLAWWGAVEDGRTLGGFAGLLAKMTGNALWGRFALDPFEGGGERTVRSRNGVMRSRVLPWRGGLPGRHDLAETVSGRVRARLYDLMMRAGGSLVSAHTDGAWIKGGDRHVSPEWGSVTEAVGWRLKERARCLDLLDPQVLRYWPQPARGSEPWHVFAGVPAGLAAGEFERLWAERGFAA